MRPILYVPGIPTDPFAWFTPEEFEVFDTLLEQILERARNQKLKMLELELARFRYRLAAVSYKMFSAPPSDGRAPHVR